MNVALIGYRWSGKTTVSKVLAERTGWPRVDCDRMVEQRLGESIPQVIRRFGWRVFRAAEEAVITGQLSRDRVILDPGGGIVTNAALMARVRRAAFVVFLDCPADVLLARSADSYTRPALTALAPADELRMLLRQRRPLYRYWADLTVDAALSPSEAAAAILEELPACCREPQAAEEVTS